MIFKDETLYIDLKGDMTLENINIIKERIFSVLEQYDIDNIILNTSGCFNLNKKLLNNIKKDYQNKYFGSFKII